MGDKKPPRWAQPVEERDELRRSASRDMRDFYHDLEELTPPPRTITAEDAYTHASSIAKRNANMLAAIAQSSGVGMEMGEKVDLLSTRVERQDKKLKWWQTLLIAAITAAGTAIVSVAKGLYEKGEREGVVEMRLNQSERLIERNFVIIEKLRDQITELIKYHNHEDPTKRREP